MKIAITGGLGFVGSNLALYFKNQKHQVKVLDNLYRKGSELNRPILAIQGINIIKGDIRNPDDIKLLEPYDVLIECAAEPSVQAGINSDLDYAINTNLTGVLNCLSSCYNQKAKFIFLSSSRVYSIDALRNIPLIEGKTRFELPNQYGHQLKGIYETFPTDSPRSIYGATKLAAEIMIQEYSKSLGLKAVINRCGVIAGPGQFGKVDQGFLTYWLLAHHFKLPLSYNGFGGKGKQVRDILHPVDLAKLVESQIQDKDLMGEIYNVGGSNTNTISLLELTGYAKKLTKTELKIQSNLETDRYNIPWYASDITYLKSRYNWDIKYNIQGIIDQTYWWIKTNQKDLQCLISQ